MVQFYTCWCNRPIYKEFENNADWLKFGFHGYGFDESETDRTYEAADSAELLLKDYSWLQKNCAV